MVSNAGDEQPVAGLKRFAKVSRRDVLKGVAATAAGFGLVGVIAATEPFRFRVTAYDIEPPGWTPGLDLRLAVIADLHACDPWMSQAHIRGIVDQTNALGADAILMLGDYVVGHRLGRLGTAVPNEVWASELARLKAPLGVHAVLGNHDWWQDDSVQIARSGPIPARLALEARGIPVYENDVVRLEKDGLPFWIAGLGDQWAFWPIQGEKRKIKRARTMDYYEGVDDLAGTLAKVVDDAPVVLMVHEPDIFPQVPERVSLTLAGHTHGGQIRLGSYAPVVPSKFGRRYVYGHIVEEGRNLLVSGGLGCSGVPLRFGSVPEILLVSVRAARSFA